MKEMRVGDADKNGDNQEALEAKRSEIEEELQMGKGNKKVVGENTEAG